MKKIEKTYRTTSGTIHYWISKAGAEQPWLIFLPGLTADHRLFDRQMADLGARFNCLVWDAPAHGASRPFRLDFSLDDLAAYHHKILMYEGVAHSVFVGQSMGGYIAQAYAMRWPESVDGVITND